MSIQPSQAFSLLQHHANVDIHPLKLANLCTDEDRVNSMISVHNSANHENVLLADYSRQRMTLETIQHLLRFQASRRVREKIQDLAWGRMAPGWKMRNHHNANTSAVSGNTYKLGGGGVGSEDIYTNVSFANGVDKLKSRSMDEDEDNDSGSMFLSLRAPRGLVMYNPYDVTPNNNNSANGDGEVDRQTNVLEEIHNQWDRIETVSESFRQGKTRVNGPSGKQFTDVLVVSPGDRAVVPSALQFIYEALKDIGTATVAHTAADVVKNVESMASTFQSMMEKTPFKKTNNVVSSFMSPAKSSRSNNRRKLKVLASSNTRELNEVLGDLSPATTIVVTLALEETSADIGLDRIVREWIFSATSDSKRECPNNMFLVTASPRTFFGSYPQENTFVVPKHSSCEAFSTLSAAGLLPLSFLFGWNVVSTLLSGAHDLDQHFVDTCPRHNLPIMLSLVDLWNDALLDCNGRLLSPDKDSLRSYTKYVSTLEDQVLNGLNNNRPQQHAAAVGIPSPIVDSANVHDNLLNASSPWSAEFVTTLDPSISQANHDNTNTDKMVVGNNERICAMFATADTFAFGDSEPSSSLGGGIQSPGSPASFVRIPSILRNDSMQSQRSSNNFTGDSGLLQKQRGNRPCTIVISGSCTSFAIGQFIALAEHRALVKAWLYECDPFSAAKDESSSKERMMNTKASLDQMYQADPNGPRQNLDAPHSLATNSMLQHYANRMQQKYQI